VYITPKDEESVYMCSVYTCFIVSHIIYTALVHSSLFGSVGSVGSVTFLNYCFEFHHLLLSCKLVLFR